MFRSAHEEFENSIQCQRVEVFWNKIAREEELNTSNMYVSYGFSLPIALNKNFLSKVILFLLATDVFMPNY